MTVPLDPLVVKIISEINTPYTACYCEENVYLASQTLTLSAHENLQTIYVVFISNLTQTVLLWEQRASQYPAELGSPVVWDYHVIMILVAKSKDEVPESNNVYVVDFDSTLGKISSWEEYTSKTFKPELFENAIFDQGLQSMFRVISSKHFIEQFASDRSHMMKDTGIEGPIEYKMPPPPYQPIIGPEASGKGVTNNLMTEYVSMAGEGAPNSTVLSMDDFLGLVWLNTT
ncbi:hypothetical protein BDV93DRAFT_517883 [Ceratobasidium sp. AG-I]|nr:hypothetical protein BDV93DRAFT_517883 [Ceratobasidium sp. AG-I]